jgi:hypothetical protein
MDHGFSTGTSLDPCACFLVPNYLLWKLDSNVIPLCLSFPSHKVGIIFVPTTQGRVGIK